MSFLNWSCVCHIKDSFLPISPHASPGDSLSFLVFTLPICLEFCSLLRCPPVGWLHASFWEPVSLLAEQAWWYSKFAMVMCELNVIGIPFLSPWQQHAACSMHANPCIQSLLVSIVHASPLLMESSHSGLHVWGQQKPAALL